MKIWFQNRRAKWKRIKAGFTSNSGGHSAGVRQSTLMAASVATDNERTNGHSPATKVGCCRPKIAVPIPVHVDRIALRGNGGHSSNERQQYGWKPAAAAAAGRCGVDSRGISLANCVKMERRGLQLSTEPITIFGDLCQRSQFHARLLSP